MKKNKNKNKKNMQTYNTQKSYWCASQPYGRGSKRAW